MKILLRRIMIILGISFLYILILQTYHILPVPYISHNCRATLHSSGLNQKMVLLFLILIRINSLLLLIDLPSLPSSSFSLKSSKYFNCKHLGYCEECINKGGTALITPFVNSGWQRASFIPFCRLNKRRKP